MTSTDRLPDPSEEPERREQILAIHRRESTRRGLNLTDEQLHLAVEILGLSYLSASETSIAETLAHRDLDRALMTFLVPEAWRCRPDRSVVSSDVWREWFLRCDFTRDFVRASPPKRSRLLFRGATIENREGISWTMDIDQAKYFARSRQAPGVLTARVFMCRVPPERMLARLVHRSSEQEVVADVRGLEIVELPRSLPRSVARTIWLRRRFDSLMSA